MIHTLWLTWPNFFLLFSHTARVKLLGEIKTQSTEITNETMKKCFCLLVKTLHYFYNPVWLVFFLSLLLYFFTHLFITSTATSRRLSVTGIAEKERHNNFESLHYKHFLGRISIFFLVISSFNVNSEGPLTLANKIDDDLL